MRHVSPWPFLLALLALAWPSGGCQAQRWEPNPTPRPAPVDPPPIPVPPRPDPIVEPTPTPEPPPKVEAVPWAKVQQVVAGMTREALLALLGAPEGEKDQRDGTSIARWPAQNERGDPRWMDVQLEAGVVLGRALWKR